MSRWAAAVVLFTAAALTRETALLLPAALAIQSLWHLRFRQVAMLAIPFGTFLAWIALVRIRVGAFPFGAHEGVMEAPFAGMVHALTSGDLNGTGTTVAYSAMCLGVGVVALLRARHDALAIVIAVQLVFATVIGRLVWRDWGAFGRVLLPLGAFSIVALAGSVRKQVRETQTEAPMCR